jgi:hypothetical protein
MAEVQNLCLVCGYEMDDPPRDYNVCPSCGTEYGVSDVNASYDDLRKAWLRTGPVWWSKTDEQPDNWSPSRQLANLGPTVPAVVSTGLTSTVCGGFTSHPLLSSGTTDPQAVPTDYFDWAEGAWGSPSEDKQLALVPQ